MRHFNVKMNIMEMINPSLKYVAVLALASVWGCSPTQYAQRSEYDDLYFSSKDKKEVKYQEQNISSSFDRNNLYTANSNQKNINPDYVQQDAQAVSNDSNATDDAGNTYYDPA